MGTKTEEVFQELEVFHLVQSFTVLGKHGDSYSIAQVDYSDLPSWVDDLVTVVTQANIRLALDRYAEPLVLLLRYTSDQCLDRVPEEHRRCALYDGCFGAKPACYNLKRNTCDLLQITSEGEYNKDLTDLINLWREGYYVVTVDS